MRKIILAIALSLSNIVFALPIDACIANVDMALSGAANQAASGGYLGTPQDVTNRMRIAMSKAYCYGKLDQTKLCQIKLDAMITAGKDAVKQGGSGKSPVSDAWIIQEAKRISGC